MEQSGIRPSLRPREVPNLVGKEKRGLVESPTHALPTQDSGGQEEHQADDKSRPFKTAPQLNELFHGCELL